MTDEDYIIEEPFGDEGPVFAPAPDPEEATVEEEAPQAESPVLPDRSEPEQPVQEEPAPEPPSPVIEQPEPEVGAPAAVPDDEDEEDDEEAQIEETGEDFDPMLARANALPSWVWGADGDGGQHVRPVGPEDGSGDPGETFGDDEPLGGGIGDPSKLTA